MLETRPKQDYQSPEKGNKSLHVKHKIDTFVFIWQQAASAFKHCMYSHVQGNMRDAVLVHCECKSDVRLSAERECVGGNRFQLRPTERSARETELKEWEGGM